MKRSHIERMLDYIAQFETISLLELTREFPHLHFLTINKALHIGVSRGLLRKDRRDNDYHTLAVSSKRTTWEPKQDFYKSYPYRREKRWH